MKKNEVGNLREGTWKKAGKSRKKNKKKQEKVLAEKCLKRKEMLYDE